MMPLSCACEGGSQREGNYRIPECSPAGRDLSAVKHPLITVSMDLLQETVDAGGTEVWFTHFNHSNPVLEPNSAVRREIERRGFGVLADGLEIGL